MSALLNEIVKFTPKVADAIRSDFTTRTLAVLTKKKALVTKKYVQILTKDDLATYTDDTNLETVFDEGLNELWLMFEDFDDEAIDNISANAFTLIISPDVDQTLDLTRFEGIKFYITDNAGNSLDSATYDAIIPKALETRTGVAYQTKTEDFIYRLFARFLNESTNSEWLNMQYSKYSNQTCLFTNNTVQVPLARELGLTFLATDKQFSTPTLFYFVAGGYPIADYYVVRDLVERIQLNSANYISITKPRYLNDNIGSLVAVGTTLINNFVSRGLIEDGTYTIPNRQAQTNENIANSIVAGAELTVSLGGAIWKVTGSVLGTLTNITVTTPTNTFIVNQPKKKVVKEVKVYNNNNNNKTKMEAL